jgi:hypothetical protein
MSWGHRPKPDIYTLNSGVLDDACQAMLKAVRVDRTHDVPYVGSCSLDGKTIYIDYELPTHFVHRGKKVDIDRYIVMHEVVEMLFEHHLHFAYEDAHQIALHAERALVVSDGVPWAIYNRFCMRWVRVIGNRRHYPNPPLGIDLQPERDCNDRVTLKRMNLPATAKRWPKKPSLRRNRDSEKPEPKVTCPSI